MTYRDGPPSKRKPPPPMSTYVPKVTFAEAILVVFLVAAAVAFIVSLLPSP